MPTRITNHQPLQAKLIFNPTSGQAQDSPEQLIEIITEMQNQQILPEVYMVTPDSSVEEEVRRAIKKGTRLVVVAGGDGTIDSVAGALVGSPATLGIIPTGTRNNVSFNLGIPETIPEAVSLLRNGRRVKIDVGYASSGNTIRWFVEAATLGLLSDLFPVADDIQHGDITKVGELLSTFISSTPSQLHVTLESTHKFEASAYMVLVANMPYLGPRFHVDPDVSWNDELLDVFIFSDMSKLDLVTYAMQSTAGAGEDGRVKRYRVKKLEIHSDPPMPVLADGIPLDTGDVTILVRHRALAVMGGAPDAVVGEQAGVEVVADPEG